MATVFVSGTIIAIAAVLHIAFGCAFGSFSCSLRCLCRAFSCLLGAVDSFLLRGLGERLPG
jgi:hypothetical protein